MLAAIRLFFKMISKLSEKLRETKSIYLLVNRYYASTSTHHRIETTSHACGMSEKTKKDKT